MLAEGAVVAGKFRLQRQIGEGGMATVWLAMHVLTNKLVALKILREPFALDDASKLRFIREARAVSTIRHANIVEVHDILDIDGVPAMVMEYLDGETLETLLARDGSFFLPDLAAIVVPVCSALATAHAAGIVHRDLKPANIFIARGMAGTKSRLVKVLDFGLAKVSGEAGKITKTGTVMGTPRYMSPEQLFGEKDVDARADIWALGIILFECLAGHRPFAADTVGQMMKTFTQGTIESLATARPDVPSDVAQLVGQMLSVDRAARIANVREVQDVLERHEVLEPGTEPTMKGPLPEWLRDKATKK